jgi:hypothetical protein
VSKAGLIFIALKDCGEFYEMNKPMDIPKLPSLNRKGPFPQAFSNRVLDNASQGIHSFAGSASLHGCPRCGRMCFTFAFPVTLDADEKFFYAFFINQTSYRFIDY